MSMEIGADVTFDAWHTDQNPDPAMNEGRHLHHWKVTCWVNGDDSATLGARGWTRPSTAWPSVTAGCRGSTCCGACS
jgi:hypothetical protein